MSDFHFLRPFFLFLWLPFVLLLAIKFFNKGRATIWHTVCSKDLLPYVIAQNSKKTLLPYVFAFIAGSLMITALAGPSWQKVWQPLIKSQSGLVIALDLSTSMDSQDIKPSRLKRALYKINDLLTARKEGQTALLVFAQDPYVVTPLTDDVETIKTMLSALETNIMPAAGDKTNKAILKACELLEQGGIKNGSILLVTSQLTSQEMEKSIELAKQKNASISVLAVGTIEGSPIPDSNGGFVKDKKGALVITKLDKENLSQLARATNGRYAPLSLDDSDIQSVVAVKATAAVPEELSENKQENWNDQGYVFVLAALPFIALFFRKGMLLLVLFLMPGVMCEGSLWKTQDQEGQELFHEGQFQKARDVFQDVSWQAAASYRLEDYEAAAKYFEQNQSVEGYYNLGTARAQLGDFEGALSAYEKALELDPDHEDTLYNKKVIEEQQKQEQEQNQDQKQEQDQNKNQEQDEKQKNNNDDQDNQDPKRDQKQEQDQKQQKDDFRDQMDEQLKEPNEPKEMNAQEEEANPEQQGDEQWLKKVSDDPGGLLRRKFLYQYQQQTKQR